MDYKKIIASLIEIDGIDKSDLEKQISEIKDITKGDYCLPCFSFAKILKLSPKIIADNLKLDIEKKYHPFTKIESINGYINFYVDRAKYCEDSLKNFDGELIKTKPYINKTLCIDYSSVNLAKFMHIGHLSTTIVGESVARINEALGYNVIRMNYVGDWGTPFGKMIAAYRLWGNKEDINSRGVDAIQDLYIRFAKESETDKDLDQLARDTFKSLENGDKETYEIYKWFIDVTINETKRITNLLGANFDTWRGESYYNTKMDAVLDMLAEKGLTKTSQGAKIVDLEEYKLGACLVQKSDGASLYATRDIAAAMDRYNSYHFDKMIYVTAVQQKLYFKQLFKVLQLCGFEFADNLEHCYYGMIALPEGKIASRKGKQALLKDILEEAVLTAKNVIIESGKIDDNVEEVSKKVGIGAVVYCPLKGDKTKDTIFDLNSALSFEGETSPYMQYTYARANNILEKIELKDICGIIPDYSVLCDDTSFSIVKMLNDYENTVNMACENSEPSIISKYLIDLCKLFNRFYHTSKVSGTTPSVMSARVEIVMDVKKVLKHGLNLICIDTMNKM